mmetsp:Transcript_13639/g.34421  ORF Transcript_13639/g.34421 Transcript_13639/m.34421 type:complete len:200 (+) Transcript_13639:286-885(+)
MPAPHRACRGSAAPGPDAGRSYLGDAHEHEPLLAAVDDDGKEGADSGGDAERCDDVKRIRVLLDARLEVHAKYAAHGGDDGEDERQRGQDDLKRHQLVSPRVKLNVDEVLRVVDALLEDDQAAHGEVHLHEVRLQQRLYALDVVRVHAAPVHLLPAAPPVSHRGRRRRGRHLVLRGRAGRWDGLVGGPGFLAEEGVHAV